MVAIPEAERFIHIPTGRLVQATRVVYDGTQTTSDGAVQCRRGDRLVKHHTASPTLSGGKADADSRVESFVIPELVFPALYDKDITELP